MKETGKILNEIRAEKQKSLEYISMVTNIKEIPLKKIEEDNYLQELGYFYGKSHIKSYLEALGVDKEKINEVVENEFPPSQKEQVVEENLLGSFNNLKFSRFKKHKLFIYIIIVVPISVAIFFSKINFNLGSIFKESLTLSAQKVDLSIDLPKRELVDFPVNLKLIVNKKVWIKVSDNVYTKEKYGKTLEKSDKEHIFKGYNFDLIVNNPSSCQFFVNGKELKYLQKIKTPQKFTFNPNNIKKYFKKEKEKEL